mgnify:CR=1 FL=1
MTPFSVTIDGKTTTFNNATELWNWCIQNKPEWVNLSDKDSYKIPLFDQEKQLNESFYDLEGVYR